MPTVIESWSRMVLDQGHINAGSTCSISPSLRQVLVMIMHIHDEQLSRFRGFVWEGCPHEHWLASPFRSKHIRTIGETRRLSYFKAGEHGFLRLMHAVPLQ